VVIVAFAIGWLSCSGGMEWISMSSVHQNIPAALRLEADPPSTASQAPKDAAQTVAVAAGRKLTWPAGFPRTLPRDVRPPPPRTRGCITTDAFGEACYFRDAMVCVGFGDRLRVGLVVAEGDPLLLEPVRVNRNLPEFPQGSMDGRYFQHAPVPPSGYAAGLGSGTQRHLGTDPDKRWPDTVRRCRGWGGGGGARAGAELEGRTQMFWAWRCSCMSVVVAHACVYVCVCVCVYLCVCV
jgi:hypothetical protein